MDGVTSGTGSEDGARGENKVSKNISQSHMTIMTWRCGCHSAQSGHMGKGGRVEWRKLFPHNWEPVKKIENKSVENSILMGGSGPGHFPHS